MREPIATDVIVVAYRSGRHLRACVEPLCGQPDIRVIVVDNACPDRSPASVTDLPLSVVEMGRNAGFGAACNAGARLGSGDVLLFLNPDATISPAAVRRLAARFAADPSCGAAGPHILEENGETQPSMRRLPTLCSAFAEALFVHHALRHAESTTELVWAGYDEAQRCEWLSGAVLAARRTAFEAVGGFDERFFMYCEDTDLCVRLRDRGLGVWYEPSATAQHEGGGSSPRPALAPLKAKARITYARIHEPAFRYAGFRLAFVLHELVRIPLAAVHSPLHLRGRLGALRVALTWRAATDTPHPESSSIS